MAIAFLYMSGEENREIAERFCNGRCYRQIIDHGKHIAQLEPVLSSYEYYSDEFLDEDEDYRTSISINYIKIKDIEKVLKQLERIGFRGLVEVFIAKNEWDDLRNPLFHYGTIIG